MGKKLSEIERQIKSSEIEFYDYLLQTEDPMVMQAIVELSTITKVFIFSGVIRNFFLGEKNNRDIDIVLQDEVEISSFFPNSEIRQNSFGGYKIICNKTTVDLWYLEYTWAFKNDPKPVMKFNLERMVPGTAFFNFSSIVYSLNDKVFYYEKDFLRFLRDKEIDVVYYKNPNYKLCIVNTFYYSEKYQLETKHRLKEYIVELYKKHDKDYTEVQLKHFGKIIFDNDQIEHRVETIFYPRKKLKKKKLQ